MNQILARYAPERSPRYTSYPTAPQFHAGVDGSVVAGWLETLSPEAGLSLYLHVPFCSQVCWYCACNMKLAARPEPVLAYAETLLTEIDRAADRLPARMKVRQIHWGGGTPTAMPLPALGRIMARLRDRFDILPDAEIAFELDPRTTTTTMIEGLAALGTTRVSLGVQEFDRKVQQVVNRVQPYEKVRDTVATLRANGIRQISFDLIYGLPHQSTATLAETVRLAAGLEPDRIALFGYAHVPWLAKNQRMMPEDALPGADARVAQATLAVEMLVAAGYRQIGLDHFALPADSMARAAADGTLRRNFQGYTVDPAEALIGFGATAISSLPQGYAQNIAETRAWTRAVEAGGLPVAKGVVLSAEDRLRRDVIERLMCDLGVDLAPILAAHGYPADHFAAALDGLEPLVADGLLTVHGSRITVSEGFRAGVRLVARAFDAYHAPATADRPRHAASV